MLVADEESAVSWAALLKAVRTALALGAVTLALPVSCSQRGDGLYTSNVQASPASRVNPTDPRFTN